MSVEFSAVDVSKLSQTTSKPRPEVSLGMNLGDSRLLPRWCPAYRQHEPGPGFRTERMKARTIPSAGTSVARGRTPSGGNREEQSTEAWRAGGLARSSCEPPAYRSRPGSQGAGSFGLAREVNRKGGTA